MPGILSPYIAGLMTKNVKTETKNSFYFIFVTFFVMKHTQEEWQMVFIICSLIYIIGGTISLFLLDANLQPWAKLDNKNIKESDLKGENI